MCRGLLLIRVTPAQEPANFDAKVRKPGQKFLADWPAGKKVDFRRREYWRECLGELHDAYQGICAYTCHYVPRDTGGDTVDHFVPRLINPTLAYEWDNFRFACRNMNAKKGSKTGIIDPFQIAPGMFELQFPSLQVAVGAAMAGQLASLAASSISLLGLNRERYIKPRLKYVLEYRDGDISARHLALHAPFISQELHRQGISRTDLKTIMVEP